MLDLLIGSTVSMRRYYQREHPTDEGETQSKHNYGFRWKRKQQIYVTVSTSKLAFYYTLPVVHELPANEAINCSAMGPDNYQRCVTMRPLLVGFFNARRRTMSYRNDQVRYIYEQIHEVPTRNRAERGIGASQAAR